MRVLGLLSLRTLSIVLGLICLSIGLSFVGNALFAQEPAVFGSGAQMRSDHTIQLGYCFFVKPTDRLTITLTSTSDQTIYSVHVILVSDGTMIEQANRTASSTFIEQFSPPRRGVYYMSLNASSPENASFGLTPSYTIIGGEPSDFLVPGELLSLGAVILLASSFLWALGGRFRSRESSRKVMPAILAAASRPSQFLTLVKCELLSTRKMLFSALILLIMIYSGGGFIPSVIASNHITSASAPVWEILNPSNIPTKDWITLFPIVVALSAYIFSYEKDSLVLRSLMLNPVSACKVFTAKLASMIIIFVVPSSAALALTVLLFDPGLFVASPLVVWHNLWIWICLYAMFGFIMITFSILPAVLFSRAVTAFVVPLFISFLLETEGFGIQTYLPSNVWLNYAVGPLSSGIESFDWSTFLSFAAPSLLFGIVLMASAYALFASGSKE